MFVTVEGVDGAGCTTLVENIGDAYPSAVTTAEPSDLEYGQLVRRNLSRAGTHELLDFYLFMADRVNHVTQRVEPNDGESSLVVSDRYADSTRAYQPVALVESGVFDNQFEAKDWIEHTMGPWSYEPDLTLYIDISVDTAIERAGGGDKYERRGFLEQVKDNYDALADSDAFGHRIVRVDGEQPKEEMTRSALGKLNVAAPDRL